MSRKELALSEYEEMASTGKTKSTASNTSYIKYGVIVVVALVLCGVSFGAGVSYQKGKQTTTSTASTTDNEQFPSQGGGPGGFGGQGGLGNGQRPNIGEVSAVSGDSITIQNARSNSNQTFKITSSTTVQNSGSAASVSDIKTGDTVLISTDSFDTSIATQIMLNPSFGPPSGNGSTQSSPSSSETENSQSI